MVRTAKGRLAVLMLAFGCTMLASAVAAQANLLGSGALVRQDQSDCGNNDVSDSDPSRVGGKVTILQNDAGATTAFVEITDGTANTGYHFFWKCVTYLGTVQTNANGAGTASFSFQATTGQTFAFDMYPDGAPSGNKFQSVRITPTTAAYGGGGSLVRQDYSDCANTNVSASDPSSIGGSVTIAQSADGTSVATVQITAGTPNTLYIFFWKCQRYLGTVSTADDGTGTAVFVFQATAGQMLTFDMYPDGAPSGNKFQSVQIYPLAF